MYAKTMHISLNDSFTTTSVPFLPPIICFSGLDLNLLLDLYNFNNFLTFFVFICMVMPLFLTVLYLNVKPVC